LATDFGVIGHIRDAFMDWRAWASRLRPLDSALPQAIPAPPVERQTKPLAVEAEGMRREDRRTA
jgi:hypothetical protein